MLSKKALNQGKKKAVEEIKGIASRNPISALKLGLGIAYKQKELKKEGEELISFINKNKDNKELVSNIGNIVGELNKQQVEDVSDQDIIAVANKYTKNAERKKITDALKSGKPLSQEQMKDLAIIKGKIGNDVFNNIIPPQIRNAKKKENLKPVQEEQEEQAEQTEPLRVKQAKPRKKTGKGNTSLNKEGQAKMEAKKPEGEGTKPEGEGEAEEPKPEGEGEAKEPKAEGAKPEGEAEEEANEEPKAEEGEDEEDEEDEEEEDEEEDEEEEGEEDEEEEDEEEGEDESEEEGEEKDEDYEDQEEKETKKSKEDIDFETVAKYFGYFLQGLIYFGIILLIFIVVLSFMSFLSLCYYMIVNILLLFINKGNTTNGLSLDYMYKNIVLCTKDNYGFDIFYILHETKQALLMLNICVYIIYLLIIYVITFLVYLLYSTMSRKRLIGKLSNIDETNTFLILGGFLFIFAIVHYIIYLYVFKENAYKPYKKIHNLEKEIDDIIFDYIKIIDMNDNILQDNNFFDMLYDSSRIDDLNEYFKKNIIAKDPDNCLEQKIIIYNLYCYFKDYINFDDNIKEKFKDYCCNKSDNKPLLDDNKNIKMTFISMLNNSEIRMIKKYNEELDYYNEISEDNLDYFNDLNKSISNKINKINITTITYPKTFMPFLMTIIYIILILILNLVFLYIIISLIIDNDKINSRIRKLAGYINKYLYEKFIFVIYRFIFGGKGQ